MGSKNRLPELEFREVRNRIREVGNSRVVVHAVALVC